jgi:hypothetical protein
MMSFPKAFVLVSLLAGSATAAGWSLFSPQPAVTPAALVAMPPPARPKIAQPTLTCAGSTPASINIQVCAGATGLPAGFSLHWLPAASFALGFDGIAGTADDGSWSGWSSLPNLDFCHGSFSGNANNSGYNLAAGACVTISIGGNLFDDAGASSNCASLDLNCGTSYVFRAFGHATNTQQRSDFTETLTCETASCSVGGCTYTQGYWKTHGPIPTGNNVNEWPVTSLALGNVTYTDLELLAIFNTPAAGNGLIALAHQLIAAKLNVASGADDTAVVADILAADTLIGSLVVPPVGSGSLPNSSTSSLIAALTSYNEGATGPGHCQ